MVNFQSTKSTALSEFGTIQAGEQGDRDNFGKKQHAVENVTLELLLKMVQIVVKNVASARKGIKWSVHA